mmetsp:Transcript_1047/g.3860  ORF Transcript_1047/g.3860 Transcript_1047/m.3860 type:complete len:236 (-) Transcript_1047:537-1244(-)
MGLCAASDAVDRADGGRGLWRQAQDVRSPRGGFVRGGRAAGRGEGDCADALAGFGHGGYVAAEGPDPANRQDVRAAREALLRGWVHRRRQTVGVCDAVEERATEQADVQPAAQRPRAGRERARGGRAPPRDGGRRLVRRRRARPEAHARELHHCPLRVGRGGERGEGEIRARAHGATRGERREQRRRARQRRKAAAAAAGAAAARTRRHLLRLRHQSLQPRERARGGGKDARRDA